MSIDLNQILIDFSDAVRMRMSSCKIGDGEPVLHVYDRCVSDELKTHQIHIIYQSEWHQSSEVKSDLQSPDR